MAIKSSLINSFCDEPEHQDFLLLLFSRGLSKRGSEDHLEAFSDAVKMQKMLFWNPLISFTHLHKVETLVSGSSAASFKLSQLTQTESIFVLFGEKRPNLFRTKVLELRKILWCMILHTAIWIVTEFHIDQKPSSYWPKTVLPKKSKNMQ